MAGVKTVLKLLTYDEGTESARSVADHATAHHLTHVKMVEYGAF